MTTAIDKKSWKKLKNSSPKNPLAVCWQTFNQQSADRRPTISHQKTHIWLTDDQKSANNRLTNGQQFPPLGGGFPYERDGDFYRLFQGCKLQIIFTQGFG